MTDLSCFWDIPTWKFTDVLAFVWNGLIGAAPIVVAWVAYKVSVEAKDATQAQRDIAANQYKISLYDVRRDLINRFDKWIFNNPSINRELVIKLSEIITLSKDIANIFPVPVDIEYISENVSEIKGIELEISFASGDLKRTDATEIDSIEKQQKIILENTLIRNRKFRILYLYLKGLSEDCRKHLIVPSVPY